MGQSFTRQEIYEKVWSMPMKKLAPEIGVTDSGLAKACRKANIPLPPRGHWAKKEAGKRTIKPSLPLRAPGAADTVDVGYKYPHEGRNYPKDNQIYNEPYPPPPIFNEDLVEVRNRVAEMVGKVSYPHISTNSHPIIKRFLEKDEARRKEYEESPYSWNKPWIFSPTDKRRFRIINAIFLAVQKAGCKPSLTISKYDDDVHEFHVLVGCGGISISFNEIRKNANYKGKDKLSLSFNIRNTSNDSLTWSDNKEFHLEKCLTDIVNEIIVSGEIRYRNHIHWRHSNICEKKSKLEEEERARIIEEKKINYALIEKQKNDRIESLLSDASSLQKAKIIRDYVTEIREKSNLIDVPNDVIEQWALWALSQADLIDPVITGSFIQNIVDVDYNREKNTE